MSGQPENVPNPILEQLRLVRREMTDVRTLTLQSVDFMKRVERRIGEVQRRVEDLRDDLEMMLKSELMGRFSMFEIQVEKHLDALVDRVAALETPASRR